MADWLLILIVGVIIALLLYAVYRRSGQRPQTSSSLEKSAVDEALHNDPVFKDDLSADQIRAMHRFFTSSA
ncbi:IMV membrane protein [Equine molluscum contagiosum-like virus]|nr:IMV membrane protein [Equine molluscum contagiosum-like virus]